MSQYDLWAQCDANNGIISGPYSRNYITTINGRQICLGDHSDDELRLLGLTPYVVVDPGFDPLAQISIDPTISYDQGNSAIVASCNYIDRDIADVIQEVNDKINTYRDQHLVGGWVFNGVLYDSDHQSVQNMTGTQTLINAGFTLPDNFEWRAHDNSNHPFNNQMFGIFFAAAAQWRSAAFTNSWQHKANIAALTKSRDVAAYDFTTGWLKGFNVTDSGLSPVF